MPCCFIRKLVYSFAAGFYCNKKLWKMAKQAQVNQSVDIHLSSKIKDIFGLVCICSLKVDVYVVTNNSHKWWIIKVKHFILHMYRKKSYIRMPSSCNIDIYSV